MGSTSVAQNGVSSTKRIIRLFEGLLVICTSSAAMAQSVVGGTRTSVASKETQRPLEGLTVTVTDRAGKAIARRTEASGTVDLIGLDAGLYAVAADGPGLIAVSEPIVRVVDRPTRQQGGRRNRQAHKLFPSRRSQRRLPPLAQIQSAR